MQKILGRKDKGRNVNGEWRMLKNLQHPILLSFGLDVMGYELGVVGCRLRVTGCKLWLHRSQIRFTIDH